MRQSTEYYSVAQEKLAVFLSATSPFPDGNGFAGALAPQVILKFATSILNCNIQFSIFYPPAVNKSINKIYNNLSIYIAK